MSPYLYIAKTKIKTALTYRFNVVSTIALQCIIMFANSYFWKAVYGAHSIAMGVTREQMLTYAVMSAFIGSLFTSEVEDRIIQSVRKGSIALDMLKPVSLFGIFLAEDIGGIWVALLQRALPLMLLACCFIQVPVPAQGWYVPLFLVSFVLSYAINWLVAAMFGMWVFTAISLRPMLSVKNHLVIMLSGSLIPLWFFPDWLRGVLELLPFPYIYQLPLSIYIGRYDYPVIMGKLGIQLAWAAALYLLFMLLQKRATRRVMIQGG